MDARDYRAADRLRDGTPVTVRAVRLSDRDALADAIRRSSSLSLYRRFFTVKRHFTEREIEHYLNPDFVNHVALVVETEEAGRTLIIGSARYIVSGEARAEVAFGVDDPHQGRGVGSMLLRHLAIAARDAGIRTFVAETLPDNTPMLRVFRNSGLHTLTHLEDGTVTVEMKLDG